jgi:hypothetical protein
MYTIITLKISLFCEINCEFQRGNNQMTNPDDIAKKALAQEGCFVRGGGGGGSHLVLSSFQSQHVNIRTQQQAQTVV